MKILKLKEKQHKIKVGNKCKYIDPTITENCLLENNGEIIGFYIKDVKEYSQKLISYLDIANKEFRSNRVPKSNMGRSTGLMGKGEVILQYSTILGSVAPRPHMKRPYPNISSVHRHKAAQTFIKAMWLACIEGEKIIKELTPKIYQRQKEIFKGIKKQWKFGNLFTSSISNFNISAPFHRDTGNIKGTVNIILTKRNNSKGGSLHVPDYDATFEQADNSMLVYPAWRNVHGVTPIIETRKGGYRNSLIFYPLKTFLDH